MTVLRSEKQEEWDRRELAQLKEELQVLRYIYICLQRLLHTCPQYHIHFGAAQSSRSSRRSCRCCAAICVCRQGLLYVCVGSTTYIVAQREAGGPAGVCVCVMYIV